MLSCGTLNIGAPRHCWLAFPLPEQEKWIKFYSRPNVGSMESNVCTLFQPTISRLPSFTRLLCNRASETSQRSLESLAIPSFWAAEIMSGMVYNQDHLHLKPHLPSPKMLVNVSLGFAHVAAGSTSQFTSSVLSLNTVRSCGDPRCSVKYQEIPLANIHTKNNIPAPSNCMGR